MANDRVILQCKYCGGWKMLLKFFPGDGAKTRDNHILEWLDEHAECNPHFYDGDLGGDALFILVTENSCELPFDKQNYSPKKLSSDV